MKLRNKLLIAAAPTAMVATAIPMTLTSCGGAINLMNGYTPKIEAAKAQKYADEKAALNAYLSIIGGQTNGSNYDILKDDARYSYALGLKSETFKTSVRGQYSSYTLDFEDIDVGTTESGDRTMSLKFNISVKGALNNTELNVQDADLTCKFWLKDPFILGFHQADPTTTCEDMNYISFVPQFTTEQNDYHCTANYVLNGKCTIGNTEYKFNNVEDTCDICEYPGEDPKASAYCGYMVKEFVLTGLTCNFKELGSGEKGGCMYTHYMSAATIGE